MGVDLKLLPFDLGNQPYSFSVLDVERRQELWPVIELLPQRDVAEPFNSYLGRDKNGETAYGLTVETPYGEPLRYTTAGSLKTLSGHSAVLDNYLNRAVWAYLACLPDDTYIALYWC